MTEVATRPQADTRRREEMPIKDMDKMVAPLLHRKLLLKVQGLGIVKEGDWRGLMNVAAHYGERNWEIVEKVSQLGARIITRHFSLLQNHGVIENV
jgi:hypothetical protein